MNKLKIITNPFDVIVEKLEDLEEALDYIKKKVELENYISNQIPKVEDCNFTIAELADYLRCSVQTLYSYRKNGYLPEYRIGRTVYFKKSEIDAVAKVNRRISKIKDLEQFSFSSN